MLNASQRRVNKNSLAWWYVLKTSWRCLEDVFARRLEDVLKTYSQDEYIGLDQDVLKTSSEDVRLRRTYSSWSRHLEDVFIKTNVCWVGTLGASLLENLLAGKGILRVGSGNEKGKGISRTGSGNKKGKENKKGKGIVRAGIGKERDF